MEKIINIRKKIETRLMPDTKTNASQVTDKRKVWPKSGWVIKKIEINDVIHLHELVGLMWISPFLFRNYFNKDKYLYSYSLPLNEHKS